MVQYKITYFGKALMITELIDADSLIEAVRKSQRKAEAQGWFLSKVEQVT
jgi:hypothetical protein